MPLIALAYTEARCRIDLSGYSKTMTLNEVVQKLSELTVPGALVLCVAMGCLAHVLRGLFSRTPSSALQPPGFEFKLDTGEGGLLGSIAACIAVLGTLWVLITMIGILRDVLVTPQVRAPQSPAVYVAQPQRAQASRNCGCYEVAQ